MVLCPAGAGALSGRYLLASCPNPPPVRPRSRRRPSCSSVGDRVFCQDGRRMHRESKRREFRSYHPKNGRGREGLGHDAIHIQRAKLSFLALRAGKPALKQILNRQESPHPNDAPCRGVRRTLVASAANRKTMLPWRRRRIFALWHCA
jgi:hypothetical protein